MGHDLSQDAEIWDDAYKLDRAHVFHSWHAQRNLDPTEVVTGYGVWLKYGDGREMLTSPASRSTSTSATSTRR